MSCLHLEECIKPGTSSSLRNWILFTNRHHNDHRTHDQTVQKFQGTTLGEFIDFEKLAVLSQPKPEIIVSDKVQEYLKRDHSVTITFEDTEIGKLFNLLDKYKDECPDLHEKVYQAMTDTLMRRINR